MYGTPKVVVRKAVLRQENSLGTSLRRTALCKTGHAYSGDETLKQKQEDITKLLIEETLDMEKP